MAIELKVPDVGESIPEVLVVEWFKDEGGSAKKDEPLVEFETDKATFQLPAPVAGTVTQVLKKAGETAAVGEVVGYIEPAAEPVAAPPAAEPTPPAAEEPAEAPLPQQAAAEAEAPQVETAGRILPAARRALIEHGLSAEEVQATGPGGRLLKEDVLRHVRQRRPAEPVREPPLAPPQSLADAAREEEVVPMSPMRRRIAERLVEAHRTAALVTTFNEIDMSAVIALRKQYRDAFQEKYGVRLGFMSFFVKAAIEALKEFPQLNAEIRGTNIVYRNYYDIGVAVASGKGLVVPVLRNAERLSFAEIETAIADFATRARENRIHLEELAGGTFTITNGGVYGSMLSTPIVNPPQSGILGMHAIQDRPVAREGQVVIRPMMYVALTYDHRIVDGREAVGFLKRIKEIIETPSRMLIEI